jgi:selenocysteine lyase/cysteine desulfurase
MLTEGTRLRDFPSLRHACYLNTAAEGIPPVAVGQALARYFEDKQLGMDGRERHFAVLDRARALAAAFYGLSRDEVAICSCSSEAFNLAALALGLGPGDEVVINDLDFPAGATPWLQSRSAASPRVWRARGGVLQTSDLVKLLSPKTRLVTTSLVSFFNGFKLPLEEVRAAVRAHSDALLAVDVTQALGRIPLDLAGADLIVSSTHKWILASHGGGLVGVPASRATQFQVPAGGWYHLRDAFGPDRFERAESLPGAASFAVGMPNFPAVYAIEAALNYLAEIGVERIDQATRPLMEACLAGLRELPVELLSPLDPAMLAGILAFRHPRAEALHAHLHERNIHVMHHAGRLRVALHGYNTLHDVERFLAQLRAALRRAAL